DVAVQEALRAWDAWRETPPLDRARHFFTLRDLMERHFEDLSRVVVQDMGKTIDEARGEVRRAIENVEVAAGIPSLMMGYNLEDGAGAGIDEEVLYQPLGVFAGISPFNFPVMVQFWFWPYAVATGNCWIAKPSEQDPIPMQLVMDLVRQAGFPAGVVNLVHGAKETVNAILAHPRIASGSSTSSAGARRKAPGSLWTDGPSACLVTTDTLSARRSSTTSGRTCASPGRKSSAPSRAWSRSTPSMMRST